MYAASDICKCQSSLVKNATRIDGETDQVEKFQGEMKLYPYKFRGRYAGAKAVFGARLSVLLNPCQYVVHDDDQEAYDSVPRASHFYLRFLASASLNLSSCNVNICRKVGDCTSNARIPNHLQSLVERK